VHYEKRYQHSDTLGGSILTPSWNPITVMLPIGHVFTSPMALLHHSGFLNDNGDNDNNDNNSDNGNINGNSDGSGVDSMPVHVVNIHSNIGGLETSTLLLSPTLHKNSAYAWMVGDGDIDSDSTRNSMKMKMNMKTVDKYNNGVVSICSLLADSDSKPGTDPGPGTGAEDGEDWIHHITHSSPWLTYKLFVESNRGIDNTLRC